MADVYPTLFDLALKSGADPSVGLIEQNLLAYPEARLLPAKTITGTSYKTLLRNDYPDPGFRRANEGVQSLKSTYDQKLAETFFLDGQMHVDEAVVGADDNNIASQMDLEADGMAKGVLRRLGKQMWYGTTLEDTKGFPGAQAIVDSSLVVDATGTTSSTGSSCYLVLMGPQWVTYVYGNERLFSMPAWTRQRIADPNDSTKHLFAWVTNMSGWAGVQFVNKYSVGRIKNLTADSGKGLTDTLVATLIGQFPDEIVINGNTAALFMTRRSARQLQSSRTATAVYNFGTRTSSGNEIQAPWPSDSNGLPIYITSGIRNTEAIA